MGEDKRQKEQFFVRIICLFTYFLHQTVTDYEENPVPQGVRNRCISLLPGHRLLIFSQLSNLAAHFMEALVTEPLVVKLI